MQILRKPIFHRQPRSSGAEVFCSDIPHNEPLIRNRTIQGNMKNRITLCDKHNILKNGITRGTRRVLFNRLPLSTSCSRDLKLLL